MYMVYTGRKLSSKSVKWQDIKNRFSNEWCFNRTSTYGKC